MKNLTKGIIDTIRSKDRMIVRFEYGFLPIPQQYHYTRDPLYDAYVAFYRWLRYYSNIKFCKRLGKKPTMAKPCFGEIPQDIVDREQKLVSKMSEHDICHFLMKMLP